MFIVASPVVMFFLRKSSNFKMDLGKSLIQRAQNGNPNKIVIPEEVNIYGNDTGNIAHKEGIYLEYNIYSDSALKNDTIIFYEKDEKWEGNASTENKVIELIEKIKQIKNNKI